MQQDASDPSEQLTVIEWWICLSEQSSVSHCDENSKQYKQ